MTRRRRSGTAPAADAAAPEIPPAAPAGHAAATLAAPAAPVAPAAPAAPAVTPAAPDVARAVRAALVRALAPVLGELARGIARGEVAADTVTRRWAPDVLAPLARAAELTRGRGVPDEASARTLGPPPAPPRVTTDPALVARIRELRAAGASAPKIAQTLDRDPAFKRPNPYRPTWIREVFLRPPGDPAPAAVQVADREREVRRLQVALQRARELGLK